jgi:hypothetical protein
LICEIEGCGTELSEGTGSQGGLMICPQCRSCSYYAKKKGLQWARHRKERLDLYSARIEYYEPRVLQLLNNAKKSVAAAAKRAKAAVSAH